MTQQLAVLGSQIVSRLALALVVSLLLAAAPSLADAWSDGGLGQAILRAGYVLVRVIGDLGQTAMSAAG